MRGTLSVKATVVASCSKENEDAQSVALRVLNDTAFVVQLHGTHRLQALCDRQKAVDVVWVEASLPVRCVTRHDRRPITEMKVFKMRGLAIKLTSIVCRDSLFVAIAKSVLNFSAAFE